MTRHVFLSNSRRRFIKTLATAPLALTGVSRCVWSQAAARHVIFLRPGDAEYEEYRQPFNKRIASRPAIIAVCFDEEGIQQAVTHARERGLPIATKSGGHSFEGFSLNHDGLVVDLSQMRELREAEHRLTAGPGCKLYQAYDFLLPRGRLIPLG